MSVLLDINVALEKKLASCVSNTLIAWPNVKYSPVLGTTWIRPTMLPIRTVTRTLNGSQLHRGLYQIDVFVAKNKGAKTILEIMDMIHDSYHNAVLEEGQHTIRIESVGRAAKPYDSEEEAWYCGILEIEYSCETED